MTYENRDGNRNNFRDSRNNFRNEPRNDSRSEFQDDGKMQLFIAKGRNHGLDEGSLIDLIVGDTGANSKSIARIKILDDFSFFAADEEDAEMILDFYQQKAGEDRPLVSKAKRKKPSGGGSGGGFRGERRDFGSNNNRFGSNRNDRNDRGGRENREGRSNNRGGGRDFRNRDGNS